MYRYYVTHTYIFASYPVRSGAAEFIVTLIITLIRPYWKLKTTLRHIYNASRRQGFYFHAWVVVVDVVTRRVICGSHLFCHSTGQLSFTASPSLIYRRRWLRVLTTVGGWEPPRWALYAPPEMEVKNSIRIIVSYRSWWRTRQDRLRQGCRGEDKSWLPKEGGFF